MKYVYGQKLGTFRKKLTSILASAVLLANSFSAAVPLLLTPKVAAATNYTPVAFTPAELTNWSADRAAPTGGYQSIDGFAGRDDVLQMSLNKDLANMSGTGFYQTEGLKRSITPSTSIKADLYVDSDWLTNGKTVRAGIWGVARNGSNTISAYPILEFTTDGHTGWRSYNTITGTWMNSAAGYTTDGWNTLEVELDAAANEFKYYVNDAVVGTSALNGSVSIQEVILNSKNYGPAAQSYSAHWSNFAIGSYTPDPEVNAENFNTVDGNYKGISVGFNTEHFGTVTDVNVVLERADGSTITKTANQGVFDIINADGKQQLTAPFFVADGTYTEASDTLYWDVAPPAVWDTTTTPVKATINVTDENGTVTAVNTNFNQGKPSWPTYFSLLTSVYETEEVFTNTSAGENQLGWMFNRDASTSTPFEFTEDDASTGDGSIYIKPIGSNPSDKFIAEYFYLDEIEHVNSISYDFKTANNADADQFYLNLYVNDGNDPAEFYDCRYNIVPTSLSPNGVTGFTTFTYDLNTPAYSVTPRNTASIACPIVPADLAAGAVLRAIAINVGDTNANDQGLEGYLDKVVIDTDPFVTTYDFEYTPDPTNSHQLNISGDVYRDIAVDNCDNLNECKNERTNDMLEGWEMRLYKEDTLGNWQLVETDTTDANGVYKFATQYDAGVYHTCEVLQSGWTQPVQTWSGSGYKVDTANQSGDAAEGPYCTTLTYADTGDRSSKSHFGNVDTTKPTTTVVSPVASGGVYNSDFSIDVQSIDGQSGIVKAVINLYEGPAGAGSLLSSCVNETVSPAVAVHDFSCAVDVSALGDGEYYIKTNARDAANQISNTVTWAFTIDTTAPSFEIKPESIGTPDIFSLVSFKLFDQYKIDKVTINGVVKDLTNNKWSDVNGVKPGVFGAVEGVNTLVIYDVAGNTTTYVFTLDTVAPSVPTITSPTAEQYFNSTPILNQWTTSTDANGVASYQIAYRYDDGHTFGGSTCPGELIGGLPVSGCRDTSATQRNHTPGLIEQGGVTIWARAIDGAGNWSEWSTPVHYYYDATPPAAPTITVSETGGDVLISGDLTNSYSIITSWPAVSGASGYEYRYYNSIPGDAYNAPNYYQVQTAATSLSGVFNRGEGLHHIQVRAFDAAGNFSGWSSVFDVIYDATAPVVTINSIPASTDTTPTITGTVDDPTASLTISINGGTAVPLTNNSGNWSYTTPTLPVNTHSVSVVALDVAGNVTTPAASTSFSITAVAGVSTGGGGGGGQSQQNQSNNGSTGGSTPTVNATTTNGVVLAAETAQNSSDAGDISDDELNRDEAQSELDQARTLADSDDQDADNAESCSKILGLCWYWWIPIVAVILGVIYYASSRRSTQS